MRLKHDTKRGDIRYSVSASVVSNDSSIFRITVRKHEPYTTEWTVLSDTFTSRINRFSEYDKIEQTVMAELNFQIGIDQTGKADFGLGKLG